MARLVKPEAIGRGDVNLSHDQQGVRILGVPSAFVRRQLEEKSAEQETLFHRIPLMDDTQACWLLLLMCAATRANFWLRAVRPEQSESFAERHDTNVWMCLRSILGSERAPDSNKGISQLPFSVGGLGLTSAMRSRVAAHWSSWADCIHMIRQRHPSVAETLIRHPPRPSTVLRGSEDLSGHVGGSGVGDSIVEDIG